MDLFNYRFQMNLNNKSKIVKTIYWLSTSLIAIAFLITGIGNLLPMTHIKQDMFHLGYPSYFLIILGVWKILAAVAIVIPRTPRVKEWAYAGMIFDLTGAAFSRYSIGDSLEMIIIPLAIAVVVVTSWKTRIPGRI